MALCWLMECMIIWGWFQHSDECKFSSLDCSWYLSSSVNVHHNLFERCFGNVHQSCSVAVLKHVATHGNTVYAFCVKAALISGSLELSVLCCLFTKDSADRTLVCVSRCAVCQCQRWYLNCFVLAGPGLVVQAAVTTTDFQEPCHVPVLWTFLLHSGISHFCAW